MFAILNIFAIFALAYGASILPVNEPLDGRIVGGRDIQIEDAPWQISLRDKITEHTAFHFCGGTIVSDNMIITAAHCTDGKRAKNLVVVAGKSTLDDTKPTIGVQVQRIEQHPLYGNPFMDNDISLLILADKIGINGDTIAAANLPYDEANPDDKVMISGWGKLSDPGTYPNTLKGADIYVFGQEECVKDYGDRITTNMFCAGRRDGMKDACKGDSGGPLVKGRTLYGVTSWGFGCAQPGQPGVYTQVYNYLEWIGQYM